VQRRRFQEYLRFGEAAVLLAGASLAIRWLPFRRLVRLMGQGKPRPPQNEADPQAIRLAVERASRRLPWRTVCFQEGMTVHWMLRRHRIDSRMHYGIRPEAARLSAHVWVEADGSARCP